MLCSTNLARMNRNGYIYFIYKKKQDSKSDIWTYIYVYKSDIESKNMNVIEIET